MTCPISILNGDPLGICGQSGENGLRSKTKKTKDIVKNEMKIRDIALGNKEKTADRKYEKEIETPKEPKSNTNYYVI